MNLKCLKYLKFKMTKIINDSERSEQMTINDYKLKKCL